MSSQFITSFNSDNYIFNTYPGLGHSSCPEVRFQGLNLEMLLKWKSDCILCYQLKKQRYRKENGSFINLFPPLFCPFSFHLIPPSPSLPSLFFLLGNETCTGVVEQSIEPQWSQPMNNNLPQTPASVNSNLPQTPASVIVIYHRHQLV